MTHADGSVTVRYKVAFTRGPKGRKQAAPVAEVAAEVVPAVKLKPAINPSAVPKITRMLVLGYHFERLVREGKVKNYAEIARLTGLSRARVTQIMDLLLLPHNVHERIVLAQGVLPRTYLKINSALDRVMRYDLARCSS